MTRERLQSALADVAGRVDRLLASAPAGERLREGALVVLAGAPNAGKSSLFNALLGHQRAIVTELAGTTRDAIEAHTDFMGWPIRLVDTAGIGDSAARLDVLGMEVSRRYVEAADLVIHCVEAGGRGRRAGEQRRSTTSLRPLRPLRRLRPGQNQVRSRPSFRTSAFPSRSSPARGSTSYGARRVSGSSEPGCHWPISSRHSPAAATVRR